MLARIVTMASAVMVLGFGIVWLTPTSAPSTPVSLVTVAPSPTVTTLPACANEDGSGQMLCMWDASEQGNGMGTDVIAGDCSIDTVGSVQASKACVHTWSMPNGSAMVDECLTIAFDATQDRAKEIELKNAGWNLTECFKAMN